MIADNCFTAESATEGHPDKMCDLIVDAVLDDVLRKDRFARVELDAIAVTGMVLVSGEITTKKYVDINRVIRDTICDIGYDHCAPRFDCNSIAVLSVLEEQSEEIALAVDRKGAGNQGVFVGFATDEARDLPIDAHCMPVPIHLAHALTARLTQVRKEEIVHGLLPDGQAQMTVEYGDGLPRRITHAAISGQHENAGSADRVRKELTEQVLRHVLEPTGLLTPETKLYANPAGPFTLGGPLVDVGLSGRKQIDDCYGTICRHGGSSLSGKDPTKTDRSATYMARYVAKNIVAAKLALRCEIRIAYLIGVEEPISVQLSTYGTGQIPDERILALVRENFDLTTAGIIEHLNLRRPVYFATACYGHFGRVGEGFTWEQTDMAETLAAAAG